MSKKIIKLTRRQAECIINETFNYTGTQSTDVNHGDEISAEGPMTDSPYVNPSPMTGDKYADMRYNELFHKLNGNGLGYNSFGYTVSDYDNVLGNSSDISDDEINIEYED